MQKGFKKKRTRDLCHSCLKKGSLCKLLKHKLVASPHPPQHVSGTGTMSNCQKKKERERDANLCWNPGRSKKEVRKTPTHFLVPLQFFGDETGTWRVKTSAQTQGDIGQGDDVMYVVSSYPWHGVVGYIGIMIQQI